MPTKPAQQIELVAIDSLVPHPDNPRQGDIGSICESIALNGWWGAVIVSKRADGTLVIVAGEHRWRALAALQRDGYQHLDGAAIDYGQINGVPPAGMVPVVALDGLTLTGERKILLADNRANDLAAYDDARLAELLMELAQSDDLLGTLFDGDAIDQLITDLNTTPDGSPAGDTSANFQSHLRQITVILTADEFIRARAVIDQAKAAFEVDTDSAAIFAMIDAWPTE